MRALGPALKAPPEPGAVHSPRQVTPAGVQGPRVSVWILGMVLEVWAANSAFHLQGAARAAETFTLTFYMQGLRTLPSGFHRDLTPLHF